MSCKLPLSLIGVEIFNTIEFSAPQGILPEEIFCQLAHLLRTSSLPQRVSRASSYLLQSFHVFHFPLSTTMRALAYVRYVQIVLT